MTDDAEDIPEARFPEAQIEEADWPIEAFLAALEWQPLTSESYKEMIFQAQKCVVALRSAVAVKDAEIERLRTWANDNVEIIATKNAEIDRLMTKGGLNLTHLTLLRERNRKLEAVVTAAQEVRAHATEGIKLIGIAEVDSLFIIALGEALDALKEEAEAKVCPECRGQGMSLQRVRPWRGVDSGLESLPCRTCALKEEGE
jgi:hypothetical protein